ncbi:hypothetical protein BGZ65_010992 [Modicella reniformis]|uniref:Uncharacterized protein n=1 Tax=Modicella reniformis TaxID=1440133 RepID=A0A9P6M1X5_9FUNG|nr:hypothetical protein BGZ65_010992 [Modicella reniformis]
MRVKSKESSRLSTHISMPCSVFPQGGTIPLILNLSLKGNATTVTKITIEMFESIYTRYRSDSGQVIETLIDQRLVTKQNCPLQDWPSSTTEEPIMIPKRLMFKVPQLPLTAWEKEDTALTINNSRLSLEKGFCHASGSYAHANLRIAHSLRVEIFVRGLSCDAESILEKDFGENEIDIWIVGNQEYRDDETYPPTYYRSFSTTLVEGDKIREMDQQTIEALQDDPLFSSLPPCYEDVLTGSTTSSSLHDFYHANINQLSLNESIAESTDSQYLSDLAAYSNRYSRANPAVLAM